ncbi:Carbohydrate esterase 4 protein [Geranomyces variabilis]|uniref:Carbohydrate esterase 4 protein n=1 Tax=Geranomyces variabilis TaxID=109894 RepID=A0AAD5TRV3_9FUNG|nr:Carbohydrate esterase 4 protein [Geranomyces variabilis]
MPQGTDEPSYPAGPQPTEGGNGPTATVIPGSTETVVVASTFVSTLPGTVATISTGHGSTVISRLPATTTISTAHTIVTIVPGTTIIASHSSIPSSVTPASHITPAPSSTSTRIVPTGTPGPDGQCGVKGWICGKGECCSSSGYCGTSEEYCGNGCNPAAGFCLPTPPLPPVPTDISGRDSNVPAKIIENCVNKGDAAFTFDDGPGAYNAELLAVLKKYNVKATFFMNGHNYECALGQGAASVRAVLAAGHQLASHTWSHPMPFDKQSAGQTLYQVRKNEDMFVRLIGESPKYFRPPQGQINDAQVKQIAALGYKIINWSIDTEDSLGKTWQTSEKTIQTELDVNKQQHPLILNHEVIETTVRQVIPWFLEKYSKRFNWVTVAECLGDYSKPYMTVPLLAGSTGTCVDSDKDGSLLPGQ